MPPYTPSVHVEFAFGFSPMVDTTDGSFVEPAAVYPTQLFVDEVTIGRGRPSEFDNFPPGTVQVNIVDRNRILDPQNTAGPYYGLLKPRVPVRVRGKIGATYYPRFYGYVDGWPMVSGRQESTVNIVATDGFKILQGISLPASLYEAEVLSDSPRAYWKLSEATGVRAADYSGNRFDGTYSQPTQSRGHPSIPLYGSGSTEFRAIVGEIVSVPNVRIDTLPITIELWFQSDSGVQATSYGLVLQPTFNDDGSHEGYSFETRAAGDTFPDGGVGLFYLGSATDGFTGWNVNLYDSQPHHVVAVIESGGVSFYHNGELVPVYTTGATGGAVPELSLFIGARVGAASVPGRIGDVATYDTALSAARISAHYEAGVTTGDGEITGARITRILDLIGWPAAARAIDNGEHILGPAVIGTNALDYLQAVAASEQGRLFMSRDGKVTFHARDRFITEATESTSQFTFSDDGAGDAIYGGAKFVYDERHLYNQAVITRVGGTPVTIDNTSSQAEYGPLTRRLDGLLLRDEGQARSIGEYVVYRYNQPQVRAESWELQPEVDADSFADVFGLEIGHRVTVENKPSNKGTQFALDLHVEQVTEQIVPQGWAIGYLGSPADPNAGTYFEWGKGGTSGWATDVWR